MQTNAEDVKVLFLAGKGRSGGTLLANRLGQMPGFFNVGELNRLRDVTFSSKRSRVFTDRDEVEPLRRFGAGFSTMSWLARNAVVELVRRRRRGIVVKYNDLAADPAVVLRDLAALVGEEPGNLRFLTAESATLVPTHSVGGNPVRMLSGAVAIEPDEEWRAAISGRDRLVTTALALPLLRRYGFPIRSGPHSITPIWPTTRRSGAPAT